MSGFQKPAPGNAGSVCRLLASGLLILAITAIVSVSAYAQTITGTIVGTVTDPSGQVIAGAKVTLTSESTGESRTATTNLAGGFAFTALQPGTYSLKVEQTGFKTYERRGLVLSANERLSVGEIRLELGVVTETVRVEAQGALVQSTSSEHSALLTATQVSMIQVRGRDVISLLKLLPGVQYTGDPEAPGGAYGTSMPNIQGTRAQWNSFSVDGLTGNDLGNAPVNSSTINMDAIAEVKVLLNSYQAEYGRNGTATINVVTKSGTREFHGTGYWYKRHEMFNANDFFNNLNGVPKARYRYNTLGFTLGGPFYIPGKLNPSKDKAFFFYSLEDWKIKNPGSLWQRNLPTEAERQGDFSSSLDTNNQLIVIRDPLANQPFPGNRIPPSRIDRNGQALLNMFPMPNFLDRTISRGNYNYNYQETINWPKRQHLGRGDYLPNEKDRIFVRLSAWWSDQQGYGVAAGTGGSGWPWARLHYTFTDNAVVLNYTRVFSASVVNEFNGGARHSVEKGPPVSQADLERMMRDKVGFRVGQFHPENNPYNVVPMASFGGIPGAPSLSYDGRFPLRGADTVFDFSDNFTWIRNKHTFKFGIFIERVRNYEGERGNFAGNINFGRDTNNPFDSNHPFANTLLGNFTSYTEASSRPGTQGRQTTIEWFAQDTFKVTRRVTLDYGVRFSWYTPWYQNDGKAASFVIARYQPDKVPPLFWPALDPSGRRVARNPVTGELGPQVLIGAFVPGVGDPVTGMVVATDKTYPRGFKDQQPVQVGPRLGIAFDVFGNGKTAIRTSGGIFYNTRPSGNTLWNLPTNPPVQYNPVIYYGNLNTFLGSAGVLFPSSVLGFERHAPTPTIYHYMFGIQQDVGFGTVLDVSYVGTLGRHLMQSKNINTVPYGARFLPQNEDRTSPGRPLPDNFFRPYPGYTNISWYENVSTSNYNSLQVTANRRFARGFQFGLAYTWSKAMDYTDTDGGGVAVYRPLRVWNYGKAGFDQTHIFVLNYTWDLPKVSRVWNHAVARHLLDNWQLSGITSFVSGQPSGVGFSTTDGADITGGGDGARIIVTGKAPLPHGQRKFEKWFETSVFRRPPRGDYGNAPKDVFRLPGVNNWDLSLFKKFPVKGEERYFQFRWEMYNAFNHTQYSDVDATARFDPQGNQVNARFGQVTSARSPRVMQGSLRFTF